MSELKASDLEKKAIANQMCMAQKELPLNNLEMLLTVACPCIVPENTTQRDLKIKECAKAFLPFSDALRLGIINFRKDQLNQQENVLNTKEHQNYEAISPKYN